MNQEKNTKASVQIGIAVVFEKTDEARFRKITEPGIRQKKFTLRDSELPNIPFLIKD